MMLRRILPTRLATVLAVLTVLASAPAWAMVGGNTDPKLAPVRSLIKEGKLAEAVSELKKINDTGSADWHSLMGYSLRRGTAPDLEGSQHHYDEALRIDPKHRGALEYSGQLYLMKGDLANADKRLATLDKLCSFGCEEYSALKKSIESYKANGNKLEASYR